MQSPHCLINSSLLKCLWVRRKLHSLSLVMTPALACRQQCAERRRQESLGRNPSATSPSLPSIYSFLSIHSRANRDRDCELSLCPHTVYETLPVFPAVSSAALSFITPPGPEVNHRACTANICQHLLSAHNKASDIVTTCTEQNKTLTQACGLICKVAYPTFCIFLCRKQELS